jgi:hypothetical protein
MISQPGEMPVVYQIGDERRYRVEYTNRVYTGWLHCPGCGWKMFKNNMISSPVNVKQEHRCRRKECKADVQFVFRVLKPTSTNKQQRPQQVLAASRPVIRTPK